MFRYLGFVSPVLLFALSAPTQAAWPELPAPRGARVENVGEQVRLNGIPMRMQRVLSRQAAGDVARHYRDAMGPRHASERVSDRVILSRPDGDYFLTVSVRPLATGVTEALVSAADVREARRSAGRPLGVRLPADTRVVSDMESIDGDKRSRQLVLTNAHAIAVNLDVLTRELAARGMRADGRPLRREPTAHVQFFRGDGREAQLSLIRQADETAVVLTLIDTP